jgi:hypothetical protein
METATKANDDLCRCPDALSLVHTPYANLCYKCGLAIDIQTWKYWRLIHPHDEETMFYAFGLKRDDLQELADKPFDYFRDEIMLIKYRICAESAEFREWFLSLDDKQRARTIQEMERMESGEIDFAEFEQYVTRTYEHLEQTKKN